MGNDDRPIRKHWEWTLEQEDMDQATVISEVACAIAECCRPLRVQVTLYNEENQFEEPKRLVDDQGGIWRKVWVKGMS